jgi:hypothetical protein
MIVNRTKTDLDKAARSLHELSHIEVKQDIIRQLRIEKARKKGYFDAAKLYFTKSAKQLGKSKNLFNNIYRFSLEKT